MTISAADINQTIEKDVLDAFSTEWDRLENGDLAPQLTSIYETFYDTIFDCVEEIYENVFGDAAIMREDWLADIGIDPKGVPNILAVCRVLNALCLPYIYEGNLYNHTQGQLLSREPNIYEMEGI